MPALTAAAPGHRRGAGRDGERTRVKPRHACPGRDHASVPPAINPLSASTAFTTLRLRHTQTLSVPARHSQLCGYYVTHRLFQSQHGIHKSAATSHADSFSPSRAFTTLRLRHTQTLSASARHSQVCGLQGPALFRHRLSLRQTKSRTECVLSVPELRSYLCGLQSPGGPVQQTACPRSAVLSQTLIKH